MGMSFTASCVFLGARWTWVRATSRARGPLAQESRHSNRRCRRRSSFVDQGSSSLLPPVKASQEGNTP